MEKQVNICDVCNKTISEKKCEICDKDICSDCRDDLIIKLTQGGLLFNIVSCSNCAAKLRKAELKPPINEKANRDIRKRIIQIFRNSNTLDNLECENKTKIIKKKLDMRNSSRKGTFTLQPPSKMRPFGTTERVKTIELKKALKGGF